MLKREVINTIQNWHQRIVNILKEGIRQNEFMSIDVENFSYRIIAMVEGSIMLAKTLDKPHILLQNIDFLESEVRNIRNK